MKLAEKYKLATFEEKSKLFNDFILAATESDWDIIQHLDEGCWNTDEYITKFCDAYQARHGKEFTLVSKFGEAVANLDESIRNLHTFGWN